MALKFTIDESSDDFSINDYDPSPPPAHSSPGQLTTFLRCPRQYYFGYILGIKSPPNVSMIVGTGAHKGAEMNMIKKQATGGDLLTIGETGEIAAETARAELENSPVDYKPGETKGAAIDTASVMGEAWYREFAHVRNPISTEVLTKYGDRFRAWHGSSSSESAKATADRGDAKFNGIEARISLKLKGVDRVIVGYIDLLEQGDAPKSAKPPLIVRDVKTGRNLKRDFDLSTSLQLKTYALAVRSAWGETPKIGMDSVATPAARSPAGKAAVIEAPAPTDAQLIATHHAYQSFESFLRTGNFPMNPGIACSWCGYASMCDKVEKTIFLPPTAEEV